MFPLRRWKSIHFNRPAEVLEASTMYLTRITPGTEIGKWLNRYRYEWGNG